MFFLGAGFLAVVFFLGAVDAGFAGAETPSSSASSVTARAWSSEPGLTPRALSYSSLNPENIPFVAAICLPVAYAPLFTTSPVFLAASLTTGFALSTVVCTLSTATAVTAPAFSATPPSATRSFAASSTSIAPSTTSSVSRPSEPTCASAAPIPRRNPLTRSAGIVRLPNSALAVAPESVSNVSTIPVMRLKVTLPTMPSEVPSSVMTGSPTHSTQSSQLTPSALHAARSVASGTLRMAMRPSTMS